MKKYVDVVALCTREGQMLPKIVYWNNGNSYKIDSVPKVERIHDPQDGKEHLKYTCLIGGKNAHLYLETNARWFVNTL